MSKTSEGGTHSGFRNDVGKFTSHVVQEPKTKKKKNIRFTVRGKNENYVFKTCVTPDEKRPPGRPRRRWKGNIKMDLTEVGRYMDWIVMVEKGDRWRAFVKAAINLGFHKIRGVF
jgi:hypothetical protein